jgi:hypothetical protein
MAELKTQPNDGSVEAFLESVENQRRREDAFEVLDLMKRVTCEEPTMWGSSIIGFGTYRYKYESGREGEWFVAGFSPRKQSLTLYIMGGFSPHGEVMARLGKYKTGKGCLYINKLDDVDGAVLEELVRSSVEHVSKTST